MAVQKILKLKIIMIRQASNIGGKLKASAGLKTSKKCLRCRSFQNLISSFNSNGKDMLSTPYFHCQILNPLLSMLRDRICTEHKSFGFSLRCSNLPFLASGMAYLEPLACHDKYSSSQSNTSSEIEVNSKIDQIPNGLCIEINKASKRNYCLIYLKYERSFSNLPNMPYTFFSAVLFLSFLWIVLSQNNHDQMPMYPSILCLS